MFSYTIDIYIIHKTYVLYVHTNIKIIYIYICIEISVINRNEIHGFFIHYVYYDILFDTF